MEPASSSSAAAAEGALPTCKCRENVVKVDVGAESASTAKAAERVASTERVASAWAGAGAGIGVESGGAELVELLPLLGVGQDLVSGLDLGELVFGRRVLVRVWVVLFRQAVVGLFDLGGRCALADAQGAIRVSRGRE